MSSTERVFKNRVSNKLDLQTQFDKANSNKANKLQNNLNLLATLGGAEDFYYLFYLSDPL